MWYRTSSARPAWRCSLSTGHRAHTESRCPPSFDIERVELGGQMDLRFCVSALQRQLDIPFSHENLRRAVHFLTTEHVNAEGNCDASRRYVGGPSQRYRSEQDG